MEASELIKKVRQIEIKTKGLSNNLFSGGYHSAFKGRGMSFSEVKEYQYGDDIRNIDWNVTARTGSPYVKVFEEEREIALYILVDVSASTFTGIQSSKREELIAEIAGVIAFSALQNNDKVGVVLFSDTIHTFIPPKKGKKHILRIIRELVKQENRGGKTNIAYALKYFSNIVKKRGIVFLFSDFYVPEERIKAEVQVVGRRHDFIGLQITDAWDEEMPDVGIVRVHDAESGESYLIDTSQRTIREDHHRRYLDKKQSLKRLFSQSNADWLELKVDSPYIPKLMHFFNQRMLR